MLGAEVQVLGLRDLDWHDEIVEDGATFEANALIKARAVYAKHQLPVLADDSGLEVDALGGAPGIYTARFAGIGATDAQNRELLLQKLQDLPSEARGAKFVCVLAWIDADGREFLFRGECLGRILESEIGDQGFGYDSLFAPQGHQQSFAQMDPMQKKGFSHRGAATKQWLEHLKQ